MGWETWTYRKRRIAGLLTAERVPLFGGRYSLPYCGMSTPFPSDYVVSSWAPFVLNRVRDLFPGWFIDIGSNVGQTLLLVKEFDSAWEYVGFEPNPVSFFVSQQLARENKLAGYRLIPSGLSDQAGVLELLSNNDTDPASTLIPGFRGEGLMKFGGFATVLVGDEALESLHCDRPGVVKIDVEGAELEVLRGLQRCLGTARPLVVCEVLALHDGKSVGDFRVARQRELERILREHRYSIYRIELPGTIRKMPEVPDDRRLEWTDFLFVPDERSTDLEEAMRSESIQVVGS